MKNSIKMSMVGMLLSTLAFGMISNANEPASIGSATPVQSEAQSPKANVVSKARSHRHGTKKHGSKKSEKSHKGAVRQTKKAPRA